MRELHGIRVSVQQRVDWRLWGCIFFYVASVYVVALEQAFSHVGSKPGVALPMNMGDKGGMEEEEKTQVDHLLGAGGPRPESC